MIRVLHVIDHLDLGGAQTALLDMLRCRNRSHFEIEVAAMHGRGAFVGELERLGLRVHSLSPAKWPPAFIPGFLALIREGNFDILHFHLAGANWIAKPMAALAGHANRIAHDHTSGDLKFRGRRSLLPDALAHLFSTRVVAVSEGVRDFLVRWEAVPRRNIEVVPNGVSVEDFRPGSPEERSGARQKWAIPEGAFVAGCIGRLAHEKNFALIPELALRHPAVHFIVAGSGPERSRLVSKAEVLGVSARVRFLGAIFERAEFYRALDVFILPSLYEGLPMALLEAMSSAVPVLSSRLGDIALALTDERDGLLAEPGNLEAFSAALCRLESSPQLGRTLGAAGRARAVSAFSAAQTARMLEALYRKELGVAIADMDASNSAR